MSGRTDPAAGETVTGETVTGGTLPAGRGNGGPVTGGPAALCPAGAEAVGAGAAGRGAAGAVGGEPGPGTAGGRGGTGGAGGSWEELVTVALLGTDRRRVPERTGAGGALAETAALVDHRDPAAALLDLAALGAVHRRAALRPGPAGELPGPAPGDPRPALPPAAERRLCMLLSDRAGLGAGSRGTAPNLAELLPQWLASARSHGYRAPASLVPALLEAARGRSDLRPDALALAGSLGLWLSGLNPDWKFALRVVPSPAGAPVPSGTARPARAASATGGDCSGPATTAAGTAGDIPGPGAAVPGASPGRVEAHEHRMWEEGLFAERSALLSRLRRRDPGAALAVLRSTWTTERAEERLLFLDALREGLSPEDEPFLEAALADRSKNVRSTAAELLSALPGSALAARMAERARACVALEISGSSSRLAVEPPYECDAAMQRDGIAPKPPSGPGERSWWLRQLVEATPLGLWTGRFGLGPDGIVALPVSDGWRGDLHAAWGRAAVRQRDAAWARALLGAPSTTPLRRGGAAGSPFAAGTAGDQARLLSVLPDEERAPWVAGFIQAHGLTKAFQMLKVCSVPWSRPLGEAVIDALDIAREAGGYPWSFSGVMGLAERCLDPAQADRVDVLTAIPETDSTPGAGNYWSEAFQRLAGTLRLRAAMLAELAPAP